MRLTPLGIGSVDGMEIAKYEALADMMERGALREARKRFPLKRTGRAAEPMNTQ